MNIYPAIDIKDGKCVRLRQGKFDDVTVFGENPVDVAGRWKNAGAEFLHIVDLDGARLGKSFVNEIIEKIIKKYNLKVQIGGGIRTIENIESKINCGAERIILGTAAVKNPELVKEAVKKYGDKIAVGIDAKDGMAAVEGWEEVSSISALDLCRKMEELGVKTVIYTDISKDGMMNGPNIEATKNIIENTNLNIIASGGISSIRDLENVNKINAYGVIIGKALYNGAVKLEQAIQMFEKRK